MKDHLNLNTLSRPAGWIPGTKQSENMGLKIARDLSEQKKQAADIGSAEETSGMDDVVDAQMARFPFLDNSVTEEMDFSMALEHINFITDQASTIDGRLMMSRAHRDISPNQVIQLLGASV